MNVAMVYTIDAYRPIAGEYIVAILGFKGNCLRLPSVAARVTDSFFPACFIFLLSFYTNPWAEKSGCLSAFETMGGIAAAVNLLFVVFYFRGKEIRLAILRWRMFS